MIIILAFTTLWVVLIEYLVETRQEVVTRLTGLDYDELRAAINRAERPRAGETPDPAAAGAP